MIISSHKEQKYKLFLNGFFNIFNLKEAEFEDELTSEIHDIINFDKKIEFVEEKGVDEIVKESFTKSNLMINGSMNDTSYVSCYFIFILYLCYIYVFLVDVQEKANE